MHPIKTINMPTFMSIEVIQAHNYTSPLCISHSPFNSSSKDHFSSKLIPHCGAYPQISLSSSSSKTNTTIITLSLTLHTSTTPSFIQHLLHHNSHTINSISFSRPPQLTSPSLHSQHPSTLSSPSHFLQAAHINHPLSQFLTNFSPHSTQTTYQWYPSHTLQYQSGLLSHCKLCFLTPW